MISHEARVARRQEWRCPDSGLETGRADFGANFCQSAGELRVGFIPVAQRGLKAVIELHHLDRKAGSQRGERLQVVAQGIFRDAVKIVVPGAPAAPKRSADARTHRCTQFRCPARGQHRGRLARALQVQRCNRTRRSRRQLDAVKQRSRGDGVGRANRERGETGGALEESREQPLAVDLFQDRE